MRHRDWHLQRRFWHCWGGVQSTTAPQPITIPAVHSFTWLRDRFTYHRPLMSTPGISVHRYISILVIVRGAAGTITGTITATVAGVGVTEDMEVIFIEDARWHASYPAQQLS